MKTNIRVNNTTHELSVDSRVTLLDALEGFNRGHAVLGVSEHLYCHASIRHVRGAGGWTRPLITQTRPGVHHDA
jgi:hypothetical protein